MASKNPQILQLTPASEILFQGPFDQVVTSYLELMNPSQEKVCFKVKTTAPRRYCVRPNSGAIEPGAKVKIAIMLQPMEPGSFGERSKHKFMVQSAFFPPTCRNVNQVWENATDKTMDSKLRCVFQSPDEIVAAESLLNKEQKQQPTVAATTTSTTATTQQPQISTSTELSQTAAGDGPKSPSKSKDLQPVKTPPPPYANAPAERITKTFSSPAKSEQSIGSSQNLTSSFLQPMSNDHKIVLVSIVMLIIGVILGKYII